MMDKILVVDGYSSVRELVAQDLADDGNMVVAIGNPASITEILDTFEPDLLILDVFMDKKMRWDVLLEIKKQRPRLPVVIFTSSYPDGDLHRFPVEAWVVKGFLFDELKQKIREVLKRKVMGGSPPSRITRGAMKESNMEIAINPQESGPRKISIH
jgi:DNA-binding response OmpR family regulator